MQLKFWSRALVPLLLLSPLLAFGQISLSISVGVPPPALPVYEQPAIPGDGYIWTPGYWAWGDDIQDYYWVPGTWILAPQPVDPGILGLVGRSLSVQPRILGAAHRFLWRRQLRFRVWRQRL